LERFVIDAKPLKEADLHGLFRDLAGLFEQQQEKAEQIAKRAGTTQPELACYMQGMADQAKITAWIMRHQLGQGGVATSEQWIKRIGTAMISNLESIHEIIGGMPL
jgi:hypothetical protein